MDTDAFAREWLEHFHEAMEPSDLSTRLSRARSLVQGVKSSDAKLMLAGNGASASIASHYALDFTKQVGVRAMAFNDAALITAYGNDYGFEDWVAWAIQHHGREGDCAVLISSSGASPNIVNAAEVCGERRIPVIAFTGFGGENPLSGLADISFPVDSRSYNVIEAIHGMWLGLLCDLLIGNREYRVSG